ncbi:MAG: hypothetical protein Q9207_003712 [Kuettlingeria erythrocarpa]
MSDFETPVPCPESSVQGQNDRWIEGGWSVGPHHLYTTHPDSGDLNGSSNDLPFNCPTNIASHDQVTMGKRKRDGMDVHRDFEATAPITSGLETAAAPIYTGFETAPAPAIHCWQMANIPRRETTTDPDRTDERQLTSTSSKESLPTSDTGIDLMPSGILTPISSIGEYYELGAELPRPRLEKLLCMSLEKG